MKVVATHRNRYPGAQPFSDDDFSRKVFFGRDNAARKLADKILANHMVTVYARSGLGKTSLLQAGVAPRLREEGFLPLFVRVNDTNIGPFRALLETVPREAARQRIDYVAGRSESLWSFFKTAEFWRGDLLQTPVLILDQFEELFTLQSEHDRAHFLNELSYLTRGVRPLHDDGAEPGELSDRPPAVNIVLSLREDCLGYLEEAAEHIPQILDTRFRLAPLDLDAAEEAIVGPAAVTDPGLDTRPFTLDPTAVSEILDHLSRSRRTPVIAETRHYVEPFQLQLICQRMEHIADTRQRESEADNLTITMADLGGEAGLTQILRDFYREAIESLPDRRSRSQARHLCEEFLISPEGRRISQEENELRWRLGVSTETLRRLTASRLLRAESRSESIYYELSHDSLIEPILESRRIRAHVVGMLGIGAGTLLLMSALVTLLATPVTAVVVAAEPHGGGVAQGLAAASIWFICTLILAVPSAILLRGSARSMLRYRLAGETAVSDPDMRVRRGFLTGLPVLAGGAVVALFGVARLVHVAAIVFGPIDGWVHTAARSLLFDRADELIRNWVRVDTVVYLVGAVALLIVGYRLCRWGVYRLAGIRGVGAVTAPRTLGTSAQLFAASRLAVGGIAFLSAVVLIGLSCLRIRCGAGAPGSTPSWLSGIWFNELESDCRAGGTDLAVAVVHDLLTFAAVLFVAIRSLRRGIAASRQAFPRPSRRPKSAPAQPTPLLSQLTSPLSPPSR